MIDLPGPLDATAEPMVPAHPWMAEQDEQFQAAVHIAHDLVRTRDWEGMEAVAGRRWVTRELDAALIAAWQSALDGDIVFVRLEVNNG